MILNEAFMNLYEKLSELNESKADTLSLIDFAGENLASRYLAVKHRLKAPENDLYYWIKTKTPAELESLVSALENTKSKTALRKSANEGAKLIQQTEHWFVYHITTAEASQKYGRDTKWCISELDDNHNRWEEYTACDSDFYFLIAKQNYNPRGTDSKFAIDIGGGNNITIYNQQDEIVDSSTIPFVEEISIPNVDLTKPGSAICDRCGYLQTCNHVDSENRHYCEHCWRVIQNTMFCSSCGVCFEDNEERFVTTDRQVVCNFCYN
jgi:hypothetical protein